ncbi:MAG TPA: hypothetical protein VFR97_12605 [Capillimicrobium sp.]|nr:hypothetical protein [Capillimicrobium sp.]
MTATRKLAAAAASSLVLVSGLAPVAAAWYCPPPPPPQNVHCNAGNGNGNEGCDPGNSTLHNRGGDEIGGPASMGGSQPNPGGNNVAF